MRAFPAVFCALALALAGCGSTKSQPQSDTVYVPDAPAPATQTGTMTNDATPPTTIQPVMSTTVGGPTVTITQIGSKIGRKSDQEATLIGLGLGKCHRTRTLKDTPEVRGMIYKVRHLVKVEKAS